MTCMIRNPVMFFAYYKLTIIISPLSAWRSDEHAALQLAVSSRELSDEVLFLPWSVLATGNFWGLTNPFTPDYEMDSSISEFGHIHCCKYGVQKSVTEWQTVQIQMRWLVKSHLIWICTVCKGKCICLLGWKVNPYIPFTSMTSR